MLVGHLSAMEPTPELLNKFTRFTERLLRRCLDPENNKFVLEENFFRGVFPKVPLFIYSLVLFPW